MNKVILVGNLTKDPELSTTNSGINYCRFTVAVQRRFNNAQGEKEADFIPVVVWRAQAENCHKYLKKGSKAGVVGTIQTRSYDAQDGSKRYVTEVLADEVEFLSSRGAGGGSNDSDGGAKNTNTDNDVTDLQPIEDDTMPF